uniref:Uncharacterized protein n=1 Tax=Anopheles atroparvus TaxID=41427 RepID=A0A182JAN1_ANOAO
MLGSQRIDDGFAPAASGGWWSRRHVPSTEWQLALQFLQANHGKARSSDSGVPFDEAARRLTVLRHPIATVGRLLAHPRPFRLGGHVAPPPSGASSTGPTPSGSFFFFFFTVGNPVRLGFLRFFFSSRWCAPVLVRSFSSTFSEALAATVSSRLAPFRWPPIAPPPVARSSSSDSSLVETFPPELAIFCPSLPSRGESSISTFAINDGMEAAGGMASSRSTVGSKTPGGGPEAMAMVEAAKGEAAAEGKPPTIAPPTPTAPCMAWSFLPPSVGEWTASPLVPGVPLPPAPLTIVSLNRSISMLIFESGALEVAAPAPATCSVVPGATDIERSRFLRRFMRAAACLDPADRLLHRLILLTDITSSRSLVQLFRRLRFEQTDFVGDGFGIVPSAMRANRSPPTESANEELDLWNRRLHSSEFLITFAFERGSFLTGGTFPLAPSNPVEASPERPATSRSRYAAKEFFAATVELEKANTASGWVGCEHIDANTRSKLFTGRRDTARPPPGASRTSNSPDGGLLIVAIVACSGGGFFTEPGGRPRWPGFLTNADDFCLSATEAVAAMEGFGGSTAGFTAPLNRGSWNFLLMSIFCQCGSRWSSIDGPFPEAVALAMAACCIESFFGGLPTPRFFAARGG